MLRAVLAGCVAAVLLTGAAASLADTVAQAASLADTVAQARWQGTTLTAVFGATGGKSDAVAGRLVFRVSGRPGFQAVTWNASGLKLPASMVERVCGVAPGNMTFTYSVNTEWGHGAQKTSGEGPEECSANSTGKHWDPTAACSDESGNRACEVCGTARGYSCSPTSFSPRADEMGSSAYRFLNKDACELGDLSGMHGELEAAKAASCTDTTPKCGAWVEKGACHQDAEFLELICPKSCGLCGRDSHVKLRSVGTGLAQMSTPFGAISAGSVDEGDGPGITCDALGPAPVGAKGCDCLRYNGRRSPSVGSMTILRPWDHEAFYLGGADLGALRGRSVVIQCGSSFGARKGEPLLCAKLT